MGVGNAKDGLITDEARVAAAGVFTVLGATWEVRVRSVIRRDTAVEVTILVECGGGGPLLVTRGSVSVRGGVDST